MELFPWVILGLCIPYEQLIAVNWWLKFGTGQPALPIGIGPSFCTEVAVGRARGGHCSLCARASTQQLWWCDQPVFVPWPHKYQQSLCQWGFLGVILAVTPSLLWGTGVSPAAQAKLCWQPVHTEQTDPGRPGLRHQSKITEPSCETG